MQGSAGHLKLLGRLALRYSLSLQVEIVLEQVGPLKPVPELMAEETDIFNQPAFPRLHFLEQAYASDATNWWVPNRACSEALLRSAGFEIIHLPEEEVFVCRRRRRELPDGSQAVYLARR